jgi:hypothetical protein
MAGGRLDIPRSHIDDFAVIRVDYFRVTLPELRNPKFRPQCSVSDSAILQIIDL